jgi:3-oxoacyl-[acyl-carrier protein] reductase
MDLGLAGRTYVVTGGSRGLGFATAAALANDGARTILVAREQGALDDACARLGPGHRSCPADLGDPLSAGRIADDAGDIDGALINVGGPPPGRILELDDRAWQAAFDSVFMASIRLIRALAPRIREGGSLLVVLSSTVKEPIPGLGASSGLRPGLAMAVKDASSALAPRVRVNGILPGRIATERLREVYPDDTGSGIPLGRPGEPAEFGRVAAFLLSPASSYVTGTLVGVDGGLLRSPW